MHHVILLVLACLVLFAASYQMLATDSMAIVDRTTDPHELEIVTRNAVFSAFTQAKHLVEDAESLQRFAAPGTELRGDYEGAAYHARIVSDGETVRIHASAVITAGPDTVDFSVSAEVEWASQPEQESGADRYLVLRAYREE